MDGWNTIKNVRVEMSEALALAKDGNKSTACAAMCHAKNILVDYCETERGPDHGFERCDSDSKREGE